MNGMRAAGWVLSTQCACVPAQINSAKKQNHQPHSWDKDGAWYLVHWVGAMAGNSEAVKGRKIETAEGNRNRHYQGLGWTLCEDFLAGLAKTCTT